MSSIQYNIANDVFIEAEMMSGGTILENCPPNVYCNDLRSLKHSMKNLNNLKIGMQKNLMSNQGKPWGMHPNLSDECNQKLVDQAEKELMRNLPSKWRVVKIPKQMIRRLFRSKPFTLKNKNLECELDNTHKCDICKMQAGGMYGLCDNISPKQGFQ
jgi:hypothetical protein